MTNNITAWPINWQKIPGSTNTTNLLDHFQPPQEPPPSHITRAVLNMEMLAFPQGKTGPDQTNPVLGNIILKKLRAPLLIVPPKKMWMNEKNLQKM